MANFGQRSVVHLRRRHGCLHGPRGCSETGRRCLRKSVCRYRKTLRRAAKLASGLRRWGRHGRGVWRSFRRCAFLLGSDARETGITLCLTGASCIADRNRGLLDISAECAHLRHSLIPAFGFRDGLGDCGSPFLRVRFHPLCSTRSLGRQGQAARMAAIHRPCHRPRPAGRPPCDFQRYSATAKTFRS